MTRLGFVTGLKAEAKLIETSVRHAHRPGPPIYCSGADAARAEAGAGRLIAEGAEVVVSFGLCAGLDRALRPGTLILAESVVDRDRRWIAADAPLRTHWQRALQAGGLRPTPGTVLGSDRMAASASEKHRLLSETAAGALDMESHGVARAAAAAGVPFLVLRAVADPAERDLPRAARIATAADGGLRHAAIFGTLLCRPWEVLAMIRLAGDARAGFATLERAARILFGSG